MTNRIATLVFLVVTGLVSALVLADTAPPLESIQLPDNPGPHTSITIPAPSPTEVTLNSAPGRQVPGDDGFLLNPSRRTTHNRDWRDYRRAPHHEGNGGDGPEASRRVPEPASLVLLGLGMVGLRLFGRSARKR